MKIGVLALQGAFIEHEKTLQDLGAETVQVRMPAQLDDLDGLIIPGGESTTIGKLAQQFDLEAPIRELHEAGRPVFGTCAGVILMAKEIVGSDQWRLGILDATVERNAYGRQVDSFETDLPVTGIDEPIRAVFIRAPVIEATHGACEVLAEFDGRPVLVREGHLLGGTFHPELTDEVRIHQYFLDMRG